MATPASNAYIQQALNDINRKIDDFAAEVPKTYVTIEKHDLQIKSHEEKIGDLTKRIEDMEQWKNDSIQQTNDQHDNMRKEWTAETKEIKDKLDSFGENVTRLTEQFAHQTHILTWVLGVFTAIFCSSVAGIIIGLFTHTIHF